MSHVTRTDRIIGITLVAVLVALLGLGLARRPAQASPLTVATTAPGGAGVAAALGVGGGGPSPASLPGVTPTTAAPPPSTPATSTSSPTSTTTSTTIPPVAGTVTAVGDSIMIDIQPYLEADIPGVAVDGVVSRQFETGIGVVQADRAAGTLGSVLVVELGTNGSVTSADVDAMMQAAAGVKRVVFVNVDVPRPWEAPDNAVLAAGVARYPGVAVLADWYTLSAPHPEWFTPDQVHLEPAGAQAMAALIAQDA
jgi:lysophospholipase L1-like esterase